MSPNSLATALRPARSVDVDQMITSFTTRRVPLTGHVTVTTDAEPMPGDLVVAQVVTIGHHVALERPDGRKQQLYPGSLILLAYGNRYAPDQFEAVVPQDLARCHLAAAGGIAGLVLGAHDTAKAPTVIDPLGLVLGADGSVVNLRRFALDPVPYQRLVRRAGVIAVVGSSMNAGKTESAVRLVRRFVASGLRVGAAKITGTGAGNDLWRLTDAGAAPVLDFTDAGFATTSGASTEALLDGASTLIAHAGDVGCDVVVIEVADGVLQPETSALLADPAFSGLVDAMVFAGSDALGSVAGVSRLMTLGYPVVGVCGTMSRSPLACREVELASGVAAFTAAELADPAVPLALPGRLADL